MTPKLYNQVALKRDITADGLRAGDVAIFIEQTQGPSGEPDGAVLEVFNAVGESINVLTVPLPDIEPLQSNEVLSVRPLTAAA